MRFTADHAAACTACHGVGPDPKPASLTIGLSLKLATHASTSRRLTRYPCRRIPSTMSPMPRQLSGHAWSARSADVCGGSWAKPSAATRSVRRRFTGGGIAREPSATAIAAGQLPRCPHWAFCTSEVALDPGAYLGSPRLRSCGRLADSLPFDPAMLLFRRCAWHSRNFGWPRFMGLRWSQGAQGGWTDGICQRCLDRAAAARQARRETRADGQR